jgi:hypothetical protein
MKPATYAHPRPGRQRLWHYSLAALLIMVLAGAIGQALLGLLLRGALFWLTAAVMLLFVPVLLMALSVSPPLTLTPEGVWIAPVVWRRRLIPWEHLREMKPYPLLPRPDQETGRRALQGRQKYRPAEGMMLIVAGLPWQYRVAGYFVGEPGRAIIAVTNRTHEDYERLLDALRRGMDKHRL